MASHSLLPTAQLLTSTTAPNDNEKIDSNLRKHAREDDIEERHRNKVAKIGKRKPLSLLDLPDELWLKIGKMAVDDHEKLCFDEGGIFYARYFFGRSSYGWTPFMPPAITQTCAAMRNELLPYYYTTKVEIDVTLRTSSLADSRRLGHWLRSVEPRLLHHLKDIRIADVVADDGSLSRIRNAYSIRHQRILQLARRHFYTNDVVRPRKNKRVHLPQFKDEASLMASFPTSHRFTHFVRLLFKRDFDVVLEDENKAMGTYQHRIVFPKSTSKPGSTYSTAVELASTSNDKRGRRGDSRHRNPPV